MEIGTAAEDAYRRDLTINALFYNINTEQVEDWTQMGLRDLTNGQIRTPLPPEITFLDDPLRVLRAVRFASRFGFTVVPDLIEAASVPQVQEALVKKVSRDRVGNELCQIFAGPRPAMALSLLYDMGLEACLFPLPNVFAVSDYPKGWTNRSVTQVARLERFGIYWQRHGIDMFPNECFRRIAVASACLSPLFQLNM
ncbi:CCA tRNA nucleotidyltransferase, mitochondrial [Cyanidiococcus yangmingshanensis]|uniref:CCA tRNA nucleotidyltransferase, mitochondrial n=1 Tax=Cyanidiococcus yangmingshanensis TaxID=2690220 RepID=A0A7J7IKC3_9RHOD|nr:CCA tRNA nucleotidyltransferase, mitochondrial [Cyanidiococcus yangmingshanensis]